MKLAKKTRKRLYSGKPVEITWPSDAPEPRKGRTYPVYTETGSYTFRIAVEGLRTHQGETKTTVRLDGDPRRLLPGLPGTRNAENEWEPEPERVSVQYEQLLADEGRLKTLVNGSRHRATQKGLHLEARIEKERQRGNTSTLGKLQKMQKTRPSGDV